MGTMNVNAKNEKKSSFFVVRPRRIKRRLTVDDTHLASLIVLFLEVLREMLYSKFRYGSRRFHFTPSSAHRFSSPELWLPITRLIMSVRFLAAVL